MIDCGKVSNSRSFLLGGIRRGTKPPSKPRCGVSQCISSEQVRGDLLFLISPSFTNFTFDFYEELRAEKALAVFESSIGLPICATGGLTGPGRPEFRVVSDPTCCSLISNPRGTAYERIKSHSCPIRIFQSLVLIVRATCRPKPMIFNLDVVIKVFLLAPFTSFMRRTQSSKYQNKS
jgi:hypothetical protein